MRATDITANEILPGVWHMRDALDVHMTLVTGSAGALLFDGGYGLTDVRAFVRGLTALPLTVLCSHAHPDHAPGCRWFERAYLAGADYPAREGVMNAGQRELSGARLRALGMSMTAAQWQAYLAARPDPFTPLEGRRFDLGGVTAQVVPMPGHTKGSVGLWVPERRLLLTGDNLNPVVWMFLRDSLPLVAYLAMMQDTLAIPFARVLCPHDGRLYVRGEVEAYLSGITPRALRGAAPVTIARFEEIRTFAFSPASGFKLVFDGERDMPPAGRVGGRRMCFRRRCRRSVSSPCARPCTLEAPVDGCKELCLNLIVHDRKDSCNRQENRNHIRHCNFTFC